MQIIKRNRSTQFFDPLKIQNAIKKCLHQIGEKDIEKLSRSYTNDILLIICSNDLQISVEDIQNTIEGYLLEKNTNAYEAYAKYRKEREIIRNLKSKIPEDVKKAFEESKPYFPSILSEIQYFDKMSRFDYDKGRRETWVELIKERLMPFYRLISNNRLSNEEYEEIETAILNTKAIGSFRALATAGKAAIRDNTCIYNCAFHPIKEIKDFGEDLYISMCGTGIGFSVEDYYISQLPKVKKQTGEIVDFIFEDTTESWAEGWIFNISSLYDGKLVKNDYSKIRKNGSPLKTKGGRSSGFEPLKKAIEEITKIILNAQERKLYSDEVADIINCGGDCPGQGGMRRTAKICVGDFNDERIRKYKHGKIPKYRENSNISEAFIRHYSYEEIRKFVLDMHASKRGENGIYSRVNAIMNAPERRKGYWEQKLERKITLDNAAFLSLLLELGPNPCGEIDTSSFCNLSVAKAEAGLLFEELMDRVRIATIIGTIQSCADYLPFLKEKWRGLCEEERLLGVDIIGQADFGFLTEKQAQILKNYAIEINSKYAKILNINASNAVTCVKPGGNSGAFLQASSGLSRYKYKYWIRNIEIAINTPIFKVLKHSKIPGFPKPGYENTNYIFSIPQKAPDGAIVQENDTLKEQLDYWKIIKLNYTEHNPSCSIYYKPHELEELITWIYENQNILGGLAFFPSVDIDETQFEYLPIQKISEEEYEERIKNLNIDWELLWIFDNHEDNTTINREWACIGNTCERI